MRYYRMIVEPKAGGAREVYINTRQGAAPNGYKCTGVLGYYDKPREVQKPCIGCVYYRDCGSSTRTAHCDGRKTKREAAHE